LLSNARTGGAIAVLRCGERCRAGRTEGKNHSCFCNLRAREPHREQFAVEFVRGRIRLRRFQVG
jgi:hypothetical protein